MNKLVPIFGLLVSCGRTADSRPVGSIDGSTDGGTESVSSGGAGQQFAGGGGLADSGGGSASGGGGLADGGGSTGGNTGIEAKTLCESGQGDVLELEIAQTVRPDHTHAGQFFMSRNGGAYVRITGDCQFWVYGVSSEGANGLPTRHQLEPILAGALSASEAKELTATLSLEKWGEQAEVEFDGFPNSLYRHGEVSFACDLECPGDLVPDLPETFLELVKTLSAKAEPVSGPVQVLATRVDPDVGEPNQSECIDWPLPEPPENYLDSGNNDHLPPIGRLVTGELAEELRAARNDVWKQRLESTKRPVPGIAIPICDQPEFSLTVSDVIEPFENEDGIIPF